MSVRYEDGNMFHIHSHDVCEAVPPLSGYLPGMGVRYPQGGRVSDRSTPHALITGLVSRTWVDMTESAKFFSSQPEPFNR